MKSIKRDSHIISKLLER